MKDMVRMFKAMVSGEYRIFPWRSAVVLLLVAAYAINPFDIIPDYIPFVGVIDDAAMLTFLWRSLAKDVRLFREWEQKSKGVIDTV